MPTVRVSASLPFPLLVDPDPYRVQTKHGAWTLRVERVQQAHPDERIAAASAADLEMDRRGQLAYSRVTGEAELHAGTDPVVAYLEMLNLLINHVRDVLNVHWIHPLEVNDLSQLQVETDGALAVLMSAGRAGGFTLPAAGLNDEADATLRQSIERASPPPVWRLIQLDARDALDLGRYEDAALLAWSALEAACRQTLPGLAFRAGLSPRELAELLDPENRTGWKKRPPLSHEEAVERVSGGLQIVAGGAQLTQPVIFHPDSVITSVERVYRLRNRIVHQGTRIARSDAEAAVEAVDAVLNRALTLRGVPLPLPTHSWKARFGPVLPEVEQFVSDNRLRIVLMRQRPHGGFFEMEWLGDELWVRLADDLGQPAAMVFMLSLWDSWRRARSSGAAYLRPNPEISSLVLPGLSAEIANSVNASLCLAEALRALVSGTPAVTEAARYAAGRIIDRIKNEPTLTLGDERLVIVPLEIARFLCVLPSEERERFLLPLDRVQPEVARRTRRWAELLSHADLNDEHSRCETLREIHREALWLDTIQVVCPVEQVVFGSGRTPLSP